MDKKQNNKKADINQKAVALSYNVSDISPRVVAKGQGYVAQKILENASKTVYKSLSNTDYKNRFRKQYSAGII